MTISGRPDEQAQLGSSEAFENALTGSYGDIGVPDIADPGPGLRGRRGECGILYRLVTEARAGRSAVLVLRGEAGAGKSALLEFVVARALDCRIARAAGVESEMELAFAGLHQLCGPMLDHLDRLPGPQRDALGTALGLSGGGAAAPLLAAVRVRGLSDVAARGLLGAARRGPLDEAVRDRIVAESRGNPLALLELPRGLTPAELAGGFGLPGVQPLATLIEQGFVRRLEQLPDQTRRLLLTAAAEPAGDVTLLWRAAGLLGIGRDAAAP